MLVSTMNDVPGYQIVQVFGEVMGLTVRSRNIGSQLGAGFKSMVGGELKGMTENLIQSRNEAMSRMVATAEGYGANAIIAFRFDTDSMGQNWTEICAYGTAVTVVPLTPQGGFQPAGAQMQQATGAVAPGAVPPGAAPMPPSQPGQV